MFVRRVKMLTAISLPQIQTPALRTSQPAPAPGPDPLPPGETIDLSSLDTPYKAAQLPILEPSFQLALAGGLAASIFAAMNGGPAPTVTAGMLAMLGPECLLETEYKIDINQATPITGSGNVHCKQHMDPISGSLTLGSESARWNGTIGGNAETLTFSLDDGQTPSLNMSGWMGTVPVALNFSLIGDQNQLGRGPEAWEGYRVSGMVGGLPYETENRLQFKDVPELPSASQ
jgi:hypothetical protein